MLGQAVSGLGRMREDWEDVTVFFAQPPIVSSAVVGHAQTAQSHLSRLAGIAREDKAEERAGARDNADPQRATETGI